MDGQALQHHAVERAEELPGAELHHPFGPDWDVWKVRGKVFMLLTSITGTPMVTLKASPSDGLTLREAHPDIRPGYHMNKGHWVTLSPGGSLDRDLIADLVADSYLLVVGNLPRRQRPIDPGAFGAAGRAAR